jgi:hypothetical protein
VGVHVVPPAGFVADIHKHPKGNGLETPGPDDKVINKPRFYWTSTGALCVVEVININGKFGMRVRTVHGG